MFDFDTTIYITNNLYCDENAPGELVSTHCDRPCFSDNDYILVLEFKIAYIQYRSCRIVDISIPELFRTFFNFVGLFLDFFLAFLGFSQFI